MSVLEQTSKITSFRKPRDETISREIIGRILEAGRQSPSPGGVKSLEFVVVESEEVKEQIEMVTGDERAVDAPTSIIILSDKSRMARRVGKKHVDEVSNAEASCAVQNMRLVAQENDVSSCWFSGFEGEVLADKISAPQNKVPMAVLSLAYTDNPVPMREKFGMNEICFYDEYGNQVSTLFDGPEWEGIEEEKKIFQKKTRGLKDKFTRFLRKHL